MGTSNRLIKRWLYPFLALIIGIAVGYQLFPTKQDLIYKDWKDQLENAASESYKVNTSYVRDEKIYSESSGIWDPEMSNYKVVTPVSDDSVFTFSLYLTKEKFYVHDGLQWKYGELPHRISHEFKPLDQPFEWVLELLQHADSISRQKTNDGFIYTANFKHFDELDFRGLYLEEQGNTYLTMVVSKNGISSIAFIAEPIRPKEVNILTSYPETLSYEIKLSLNSTKQKPTLPKESVNAEEIQ
ncbi:hypothetical protein RZN22_12900 [Bacillaceae bacterium S4-13-58]